MERIHINGVRVEFMLLDDEIVIAWVDGVILGGFPNSQWAMEAVAYRLEQRHRYAGSHRPAA